MNLLRRHALLLLAIVLSSWQLSAQSTCSESLTTTGDDQANVSIDFVAPFACTQGGAVSGLSLNFTDAGAFCGSWYAYDLVIDGTTVLTDQCAATISAASVPATASTVSLVINDLASDGINDNVTFSATLNITYTPPPCPFPTNLNAGNVGSTTANLTWDGVGSAVDYDYLVVAAGAGTTGTPVASGSVAGTSVAITGLMPDTQYDAYVRSECGVDGTSPYSAVASFLTAVSAAVVMPGMQVCEDFASSSLPNGWTVSGATGIFDIGNGNGSSLGYALAGSDDHTSGDANLTNFIYVDGSFPATQGDVVSVTSPPYDISQINSMYLTFWFLSNNVDDAGNNTITAEVEDVNGNFVNVETIQGNFPGGWQQAAIDVNATGVSLGALTRVRLNFVMNSTGSLFFNDLAIDDVCVEQTPTCLPPTDITITELDFSSVQLDWTASTTASAQSYTVEYGLVGFTPGTGQTVSGITGTSVVIDYLFPGLQYEYRVASDCGPVDGPSIAVSAGVLATSSFTVVGAGEEACTPFAENGTPQGWNTGGTLDVLYANGNTTGFPSPGGGAQGVDDHTTGAANSTFFAWVDAGASGAEGQLISGFYEVSALANPVVSFWFYSNNLNDPNDLNQIVVEAEQDGAWVELGVAKGNASEWQEVVYELDQNGVTNDTTRLRFRLQLSAGSPFSNDVLLDDICVKERPDCLDPSLSSITAAATDGTVAVINFGGVSTATSYNIAYGPAGFELGDTTETLVTGLTNTQYTISGLMGETDYEVYVQANCENGTVGPFIGPVAFTTPCASFAAPICEDFPQPGAFSDCYEITGDTDGWRFGTGFNTSGGSPTDHTGNGSTFTYADFSFINPGVNAEFTTPIYDISGLTEPYMSFWVWAGLNSDATLNSNGLNTLLVEVLDPNTGTFVVVDSISQNVTDWVEYGVNINALPFAVGNTLRARFSAVSTAFGSDFFNDIAVDDICVEEAPSCIAASNITVDSVVGGTVFFSFLPGGANAVGYNVIYGAAGFDPATSGITAVVAGSPASISGLLPSTDYELYIQTDCGPVDSLATIAGPATFATACAPVAAPVCVEFPTTDLPNCFEFQNDVTGWEFSFTIFNNLGGLDDPADHTPGGGTQYITADFSGIADGDTASFVTAEYDISSLASPELSFWYYAGFAPGNSNASNGLNTLSVEAFDFSTGMWMEVTSFQPDVQDWTEFTVDLTTVTFITNIVQLRFNAISTASGNDFYHDIIVDDICLRETPTCFSPTALAVDAINGTDVTISFDATGTGATSFNVIVGPQGFDPETSGTTLTTTGSPFTISGILLPSTDYTVYVQSDCGANGLSAITASANFSTPCAPAPVPTCETFPGNVLPTCFVNNDAFEWEFGANVYNTNSGLPAPTDHTGDGSGFIVADFSSIGPGDDGEFETGEYDISTLTNPFVSYFVYGGYAPGNANAANGLNSLVVQAFDYTNNVYITVDSFSPDNQDWTEYTVNVGALSFVSNTLRLRFVAVSTATASDFNHDIAIDDICIEEAPTCVAPGGVTFANVTSNSADVTFVGATNAVDYTIIYGPVGFDPMMGMGDTLIVTASPATITGLPASSSFEVYLQTNCGAVDGVSEMVGPFGFDTQCGPFAVPVCEPFEELSLPQCYEFLNDLDGWEFGTQFNTSGIPAPTDHTDGGGTNWIYADFSDIAPATPATFQTAEYDVSTLTDPFVSYYVYSGIGNNASLDSTDLNTLTVELYDNVSMTWTTVDSFVQNEQDWVEHFVDITALPFTVGDTIQLRFNAIETGTFNNDIAIDDICVKEQPAQDVGVAAILSPLTGCGLGIDTVSITIENVGFFPASGFFVYYSVNGGPVVNALPDGFVSDNVSPQGQVDYTFTTTFDFTGAGDYTIQAWTEWNQDANLFNDTATLTITNLPLIDALPYSEDWENGPAGWQVSNESAPAFGTPSTTVFELGNPDGPEIDEAGSGNNAWVTNLDGIYDNNTLTYLESPCLDFSGQAVDPDLSFAYYIDSETNWDGLWVEVSTDAGNTYTVLGAVGTGTNWYNTGNFFNGNIPAGGWSNVSGTTGIGWVDASQKLDGTAGESNVKIRFAFASDGSVNADRDGAGVDNIVIAGQLPQDIAIIDATNIAAGCGLVEDSIVVTLANLGTDPIDTFDISYTVNDTASFTETVVLNIPVGDTVEYVISQPFNTASEATAFTFDVTVDLNGDIKTGDNVFSFDYLTEQVYDLPLVEDLEGTFRNAGEGFTQFGNFGIGDGHGAPSNVFFSNLNNLNPQAALFSPSVGPVNAGDSLFFDYRIVDAAAGNPATTLGAGDVIQVAISSDCGANYNLEFTIDVTTHTATTALTTIGIDLSAYAGQNIEVIWLITYATGDYFVDLDNINFSGCGDGLDLDVLTQDELFNGQGGQAAVLPRNGFNPYTYNWSNGDMGAIADSLVEGTYFVTVTDLFGCVGVDSAMIEYVCPPSFGLAVATMPESQEGATFDGMATVTIEGEFGTAPFSYEFSDGSTGNPVNTLTAGGYTVVATDDRGCTDSTDFTVGFICPSDLGLAGTSTPATTFGVADGSAIVTPTRGEGPYTYMWVNGSMMNAIDSVAPGNYGVTVTDANGCSDSTLVTVGATCPQTLGLTADVSGETAAGAEDGSVTVSVAAGTGPYMYSWSNGATGATVSGLAAGDYTVTVTDANGCQDEIIVTVDFACPTSLGLIPTVYDETAEGAVNGVIVIDVTNGVGPYTFDYGNGVVGEGIDGDTLYNVAPGVYTVNVTDANGCTDDVTVRVLSFIQVGVENIPGLESLLLTPNPTFGPAQLTLEFGEATDVSVQLMNVLGQVLVQDQEQGAVKATFDFDLSTFAEGVYMIRIEVEGKVHTERIVRLR